jgi:DNA mismatch repair ATPase MutS
MRTGSGHDRSVDGIAADLSSLLWPPGYPPQSRQTAELHADTAADLDLGPLVGVLCGHEPHREPFVRKLLTALCTDAEVITYRQQILTNLLEEPGLRERLTGLLRTLSPLLRERLRPLFALEWSVSDVIARLGELEMYVDAALGVSEALDTPSLRAPGLVALRDSIEALIRTSEFETLRAELPALRSQLDGLQSVTIGVNLSPGLQPESATVLSLDAERIEGRGGVLHRLLGSDAGRRGITRLRGEPGGGLVNFFPPMRGDGRGRENELVADLQLLLQQLVEPIGEVVDRYVSVRARDFALLEAELAFFLHAAGLVETLRAAGLPICCPHIAPIDDRITYLEEGYNVALAIRMLRSAPSDATPDIITNPVTFNSDCGRVWVLTGPNRGGKTTYARAVGLAHLLLGAGLYVPAAGARMSPVDVICTHFPSKERATPGEGRLDEEAKRLAEIFREATPHSLVLLNEVLSGTSTLEALALARDAVRGLHLLGVRAIYVTHLHELATCAGEINETTPGDGTVGSLVSEVDGEGGKGGTEHRRTYRIRPAAPLGRSYASEIAEQHGISYRQLVRLLEERGVIREVQAPPGDAL